MYMSDQDAVNFCKTFRKMLDQGKGTKVLAEIDTSYVLSIVMLSDVDLIARMEKECSYLRFAPEVVAEFDRLTSDRTHFSKVQTFIIERLFDFMSHHLIDSKKRSYVIVSIANTLMHLSPKNLAYIYVLEKEKAGERLPANTDLAEEELRMFFQGEIKKLDRLSFLDFNEPTFRSAYFLEALNTYELVITDRENSFKRMITAYGKERALQKFRSGANADAKEVADGIKNILAKFRNNFGMIRGLTLKKIQEYSGIMSGDKDIFWAIKFFFNLDPKVISASIAS